MDGSFFRYLCAPQMVWGSTSLRYSDQWSSLTCSIHFVKAFQAIACSWWMGWSRIWCFAFDVLARYLRRLLSCLKLWNHHRFANGDGLDFGTISWMVSMIASFRHLSWVSTVGMEWMGFGLSSCWRHCWSLVLNFSQSVMQKLCLGVDFISSRVSTHSMMMGKWSVFTGIRCSTTSHLVMESIRFSELNMLSGLV